MKKATIKNENKYQIKLIHKYKETLKKRPHDIRIHKKLLKIYSEAKMYPEVSLESETVYWLWSIKRRCSCF